MRTMRTSLLTITATMWSSSPSILLPNKWVRTITPYPSTATATATCSKLSLMSNGSSLTNTTSTNEWKPSSKRNLGRKLVSPSQANNLNGIDDDDEHQQQQIPPGLLTVPTILTLGRVAAIPLLIISFYRKSLWATTVTTSIFVVAAFTDWLDGYIARKMRLSTPFGAFLDPVADKLMVATTLLLLCTRPLKIGGFGEISWLLPVPSIGIIGREITMSAVREWAASQNGKVLEAVAVNKLGKWKTATQMIALTILLITRDTRIVGSHILVPGGVVLLFISAGLSVWSLFAYMRKIWRILLKL